MSKAVISPSGKFYGSEQTLLHYLNGSELSFDVYVKYEKEGLFDKLIFNNNIQKHKIIKFWNPKILYVKLVLLLMMKYDTIYVNEGGHIRYIKLLAHIFRNKRFIVHIRLTEDAQKSRLNKLPPNVHLISVSSYIKDIIFNSISVNTDVLSSPYRGGETNLVWDKELSKKTKYNIGIIGRVTPTKGLDNAKHFIHFLEKKKTTEFEFHFYGDIEYNISFVQDFIHEAQELKFVKCVFHGFTSDKNKMYLSSDIIIHFNENEPLGVVFFEALNYKRPFIGFDSGGIGEVAKVLNLSPFVQKEKGWEKTLLNLINTIDINRFQKAYEKMLDVYSPSSYCKKLDQTLTNI